jgi:hypothetical protein
LRVRSDFKLEVLDYVGGGRVASGSKTLSAMPASIVFNLNATGWSVDITGTTFTDTSTTTSGTWANISSATFATDAALVLGTYQEGGSVWTSGDPITLGGFEAIAIPEPGTYALLAGLTGLVFVMIRRRR